MSKRRLRDTCDARTHRILDKIKGQYCPICCKRNGWFYADCSPNGFRAKGKHGGKDGKLLYTWKARVLKSWKNERDKQWRKKRKTSTSTGYTGQSYRSTTS